MNLDHLLPKNPEPPEGTIYSYADGAANLYFITEALIEYAPMTPIRSSSGEYSGGDPLEVTISQEQFLLIGKVFEQAAQNKADHISDRVKMSGIISFDMQDRSYNLAANSISKIAVENILNQLLVHI